MSATDIRTPAAEPPSTPSFWARMRGAWLIPGLAVAGSAALVLILVKPMAADSPSLEEASAVATNKDSSKVQAEAAPRREPPLAQEEDAAPVSEAVAGQAKSEAAPPPPAEPAAAAAAPTTRSAIGKRDAPMELEPEPEAEPSPEVPGAAADASIEDEKSTVSKKGWNAIEQGDSAREGGDCFSARNHYARALDDGNDSVRARAYAGMGLCKRKDGNTAAADEYFDKARELDEDAIRFADTRAEEKPSKPAARRPKKKASRKRKKSMDFEESMDPFK